MVGRVDKRPVHQRWLRIAVRGYIDIKTDLENPIPMSEHVALVNKAIKEEGITSLFNNGDIIRIDEHIHIVTAGTIRKD